MKTKKKTATNRPICTIAVAVPHAYDFDLEAWVPMTDQQALDHRRARARLRAAGVPKPVIDAVCETAYLPTSIFAAYVGVSESTVLKWAEPDRTFRSENNFVNHQFSRWTAARLLLENPKRVQAVVKYVNDRRVEEVMDS